MKYPCGLIRDLLPLYHDGIAAPESREAVEAHMQECEACRAEYDKLRGGDYLEHYMYDAALNKQAVESYQGMKKKEKRRVITIIVIAVAAAVIATALPLVLVMVLMMGSVASAKVEVHDDIAEYQHFIGASAEEKYRNKWGMDESIFPAAITPEMDVQDFRMVYYNPWDAQYLAYLTVKYDDAAYAAERVRLEAYPSTDYIGYYSVQEETTYELLAVYADAYQGFVYALTDGEGTIIYAEQIFCNYQMDLDYTQYMDPDYFLDGFDAQTDNPYQKEQMGER